MKLGPKAIRRVEEALREIAVLFVALAPLDVFLGNNPVHAAANGVAFVTLGVLLFVVALYIEGRRLDVP